MYTVCHKSLPKLSFFSKPLARHLPHVHKRNQQHYPKSLAFSYGFPQALVEDAAIFLQMEAMDSI